MGVLLDFWGVHEPRERSSPEVVLLPWSLSPGSCCYVLSPRVLAVLEMSSSVKVRSEHINILIKSQIHIPNFT